MAQAAGTTAFVEKHGLGLLPYTIPEIGLVPLAEWFAILLHAALDGSNSASDYITHLLSASQIASYGLGAALLFPLVAAVLLLILTKGRLSYKPDRVVQSAEALRPAKPPAANV